MYPTPETCITEGIWLRDIQVRLVRNLPGLWRFSGRVHSNIEVAGAGRIVDAPLLHLALLVADLKKRRAKVEAYERVTPGLLAESGVPLNSVFVPEDMGVTSLSPSRCPTSRPPPAYLRVAHGAREGAGAPADDVPTVAIDEIVRWNGERSVSADAYRARVTLPHGVGPMPEPTTSTMCRSRSATWETNGGRRTAAGAARSGWATAGGGKTARR